MVWLRTLSITILSILLAHMAAAQNGTVIFSEPGFPVADSTSVSEAALSQGFAGSVRTDAAHLEGALAAVQTRLLVLPYGSAYPETAWPALLRYLDRGGNLIVLGGKPFGRDRYRGHRNEGPYSFHSWLCA